MESPAPFLGEHRFKAMFTNLLGWDHANNALKVSAAGRDFSFTSVAHKRGLQVLHASTENLVLINRGLLRNVQRLVAKTFHEHILIFSCENPRKQVWQWAIFLPDGRKVRHREHPFFSHLPPEPFLNRLGNLRFTLDEEENATLMDALDRVRRVLDTSADLNLFVKHPRYAERSAELFAAAKNGDVRALHRFLVFHLPLARKISTRLCRWFGMLPEDAEQIGFFGLMEAARRFRPELGCQFSTYATPWVKQVCQRYGPTFRDRTRLCVRPFASPFVMGVGPSENLLFRQRQHGLDIQLADEFSEQLCKRGTGSTKTTIALTQCRIDSRPCFLRGFGDRTRIRCRPFAGTLIMSFGPTHNLLATEAGQIAVISHASLSGEHLGQR
jgi:RNA polymerase sigma factor (sigma-70 family)